MGIETWGTRNIITGTLVIASVAAALAFMIYFSQVVFSILLALTLSVAVEPVVNWLQGRGMRRLHAALLVYLLLLLMVVAVIALLAPLFISQTGTISAKLPEYYQTIRSGLTHSRAGLLQMAGNQLPPEIGDLLSGLNTGSATSAWQAVAQVANTLFSILIIYLLSFYWTLDNERAMRFFILRLPEARREGVRDLSDMFKDKVGAFLRGQTLLCVIVGAMAVVIYLVIRLPYAFSLGLVFGIFEALPMIGPVIGLVPAALLALAVAPDKFIWVIAGGILIQQLENNLLVPRVMDKAVGVSPVVSILAIGAFTLLFGIPGAVLAVPMAAVIQVLLDRFVFSNPNLLPTAEAVLSSVPAPIVDSNGEVVGISAGSKATTEPEKALDGQEVSLQAAGRDRLSVLNLELHELTQDIRKQQRIKEPDVDSDTDEIEDGLEALATRLYELIARHISNRNDQSV